MPCDAGQVGLRLAGLGQPQVVEAEVGREVRLVVAGEQRVGPAPRCVHSVKPWPHQASFSGMGWNCGR